MRRSMLLAATVLIAMLSACGTETTAGDPPGASAADAAPFVVADGEVMVSCGSGDAGWPPSVMTEGVQGALSDDEARRIFQGILSDPMTGDEAALSLFPDGVDVTGGCCARTTTPSRSAWGGGPTKARQA